MEHARWFRSASAYVAFTTLTLGMVTQSGLAQEKAPRADGYRGIWFELGQKTQYGDKYSGGLSTYTANHVPMAIYSPQANKTFFTYGGEAFVNGKRQLQIMVSYFDHNTKQVPRPALVHDKVGVNDPHDNASLCLDDKGYLWVFVSGRGRQRPGFIYRSSAPYSIDAFERVVEDEMTYPQPWFESGRGFLHLFTKYTWKPAGGRQLYWNTSPDGRNWSPHQQLSAMEGHYQVSGHYGGMIGSFFNVHPNGDVDKRTNIYYVQTKDWGKTWMNVRGEKLALPLRDHDNPALVEDLQSKNLMMYTDDLNFDAEGRPLLLYVRSQRAAPGPPDAWRDLCLTRWDGKSWQTHVITRVDHNYDTGSLYVTGKEWIVIAPTLPGPQPLQGGGEICIWKSRDQGKTWKQERQVTSGSPFNHNYSRRPLNAKDPFFSFWADGNPLQPSQSRLYFCDSKGKQVFLLPTTMTGEFATPETAKPQQR